MTDEPAQPAESPEARALFVQHLRNRADSRDQMGYDATAEQIRQAADMIERLAPTTARPTERGAVEAFKPWLSASLTPPSDWDGTGEAVMVDPSDMHVSIGVPPKEMPWQRTIGWKVIVAYTPVTVAATDQAGEVEETSLERAKRRQAARDASGNVHIEGSIYEGMEASLSRSGRTIAHVARYADAVEIAAALDTQPATGRTMGGEKCRHVKRGTVYEVVGTAELQTADGALVDGSALVVYRGDDGKLWAREEGEFHDGRFAALQNGGE